MSEAGEISKLAKILYQNGDQVLNASSKLSLNAILLQKINKEFQLFLENDSDRETFQVLANTSGSQLIQDLHFLHDFMQKTVGLKLTNNTNLSLLNNKIDISKFKCIKYLEMKKVPIKEIIGLKLIQSQLESIVCIRCLSKIEQLLAECGGDNSSGFVWSELREAVITYNSIKTVDTSIALAPWLEVLDLSHNQLDDVKALECLPNLKYINLSFNKLNTIPTFNKSARKKLQVLVLKNNYIEDLTGLAGLDYLTELDVSWNWVSHYECLCPFLAMSALQSLLLRGNPIHYHKSYRKNIVCYLHISASFSDFVLDNVKLSKFEKSIVGCKLCQPSRSANSSPVDSLTNNSSLVHSPSVDSRLNKKKSGKVKLAVIPNLDDGTFEEVTADISAISFKDSICTEHLITKKKIENARATYGSDNWLRCEAGSVVQDILGLPPTEAFSSTPLDEFCLEAALSAKDNIITTKAVIENYSHSSDNKPDDRNLDSFGSCHDECPSNYFSVENISNRQETTNDKDKYSAVESKETSPDIEQIQDSGEEMEDQNEKLYIVTRITKLSNNEIQEEELFLTLTDSELKEKDSNRGRVITKWSMSSLESCTKLQSDRLHLTFDTIKKDKKERVYDMEPGEAYSLFKILIQILESRPLRDMNQKAYKCVSCSSQFSTELKPKKQEAMSQCPICNSKLILELDDGDSSVEADRYDSKSGEKSKPRIRGSHNRSSSDTVESSTAQGADDIGKYSSHSSVGSAASLDELNELPAFQNTNIKSSDSDIEILSNPSQSSVEVLDGPTRMYGGNTPLRKGCDERQTVKTPVNVPPNASHLSNVGGLVESSSSGSVTDSVCTAYETSSMINPPLSGGGIDGDGVVKKDNKKKLETESLCEKTSEGNRGPVNSRGESEMKKSKDAIQYSYSNFTKIDHRIKLFLYCKIFDDNSEEFNFILRCSVLPNTTSASFESCVVCSNKKLYIFKVTGPEEGHDASEFLQTSGSLQFKLKSIKSVDVLTWHQGFSVKLQEPHCKMTEFLILLKDNKRTRCFLDFVQSPSSELSANCKINSEHSEKPYLAVQHLLVSGTAEDSNVHYFSMFGSCTVPQKESEDVKVGAILTNSTDLLLFHSEPTWFLEGVSHCPQPAFRQKLSNLMAVEVENCRVCLRFLNKSEVEEEMWDIMMETPDAVQELINSLKSPWEELFSIPLQVSNI